MKRRPPLTPEQREFIRTSGAAFTVSQLAARFNADPSVVSRIVTSAARAGEILRPPKEEETVLPQPMHWCTLHKEGYPCPYEAGLCLGMRKFRSSVECPLCLEANAAYERRRARRLGGIVQGTSGA